MVEKAWLNKNDFIWRLKQTELKEMVTAVCSTHASLQPQRNGLQVMTACVLLRRSGQIWDQALTAADGVMRSTREDDASLYKQRWTIEHSLY